MAAVTEKVLHKYIHIRKLEAESDQDGERKAARAARAVFEKKYPHILSAYMVHMAAQEDEEEDYDDPFPAQSNREKGWDWGKFANMAEGFFSQMKEYAEFAKGTQYAQELANRAVVTSRNNPSGSMTLNFRIEAVDLDTLEGMTSEQREAYIAEAADFFVAALSSYMEEYLSDTLL